MLSRVFHIVALGSAMLCWTDGARAQSFARSSLSGKITNSSPSGFSVKLKPVEKNPLASYDGYSTQAASNGEFQFEDVKPGRYVVVGEGPGFMPTEYRAGGPQQTGTPIELKSGEHRKGLAITLAPKRVVCGRVTDEQANPLSKVEVYAFHHLKGSMWLSGGTYVATDDEGNYRFSDLELGEYFLWAGMSTWFSGSQNLTQIDAENLANAAPVEVGQADGSGCRENIRIGQRTGYQGFKIRGKIAEDPSLTGKDLVLSLLECNRAGVARVVPTAEAINPGTSFELWPVPAGHYRLILSSGRFPPNGSAGQPAFTVLSSQEITGAAGTDVNGITVAPDPQASLTGQVKFEDSAPAAACPTQEKTKLRIQKEDDGQFQNIELGKDGKVSFAHVPLGTYTVRFYPVLRGSVYAKSMLFDGHAVDGRRITISTAGPHSLELVLSGDAAHAPGHITPDEPLERYRAEGTHPKASVSGKVTNTKADAPLVKLWALRFNSDRSYEYSAKPGPDGSFHFENVDPGIYFLVAQGPGYTLSEYGASYPGLEGKAITLSAGQRLEGLTLTASPRRPGICGQVTDENGRPLPNVAVFAAPSLRLGRGPSLSANADANSSGVQTAASVGVVSLGPPFVGTDSAGNFQFFDLRPGLYFLWTDFMVPNGQAWSRRWTYFPSSPDFDGARPVKVDFGADTGCTHNIQMHNPGEFHVRGKVPRGTAHADGEYFNIELVETNSAGAEGVTQIKNMLGSGEAFDFANVNAGHYSIRLRGPFRKPPEGTLETTSGPWCPTSNLVASGELVVRDADLNDVTMVPIPLLSVAGEIRFEDIPKEWRAFQPEAQTLTLSPVLEFPSLRGYQTLANACPLRVRLTPDGKFAFERVMPGSYQIGVDLTGVQGDALYLKSIALNSKPVKGRRITLKPGNATQLTMVVSNNGGWVSVGVKSSGPPAEEYRYEEPCRPKMAVMPKAVLIPDSIPVDGSGIVTGGFSQSGFVEFYRVPPGRYHAVAGENFNFHGHSVWTDPKFLQSMRALGTPVEVAAGQKIKLSVPDATVQMQDLLAQYNEEVNISDHCAASCSYDGFWKGVEAAEAHKP